MNIAPPTSSGSSGKRIAVIGAGWAGLAAAQRLMAQGHHVTLFEASRHVGGRARSVEWQTADGRTLMLDNGQHIFIGAYCSTLALMHSAGIDVQQVLHRLPLTIATPPSTTSSDFHLRAPKLPAPLHLLVALLSARGLTWTDRIVAVRLMQAAKKCRWSLPIDCSVSAWLAVQRQTPTLQQRLWHPLCLAALNTPPELASAQVFLNVLRDSLGGARHDADFLLPTQHLGALLPEAMLALLRQHGSVHLGTRVTDVYPIEQGIEILAEGNSINQQVHRFDATVLAVSVDHVPALLTQAARARPDFKTLIEQCQNFTWQPITTVYLRYAQSIFTSDQAPMLMLEDDPARGHYGQWVFDRERLNNDVDADVTRGLSAVVISADGPHRQLDHDTLAHAVAQQIQQAFATDAVPLEHRVITEKRATFACTIALDRPDNITPDARLMLAGDYTKSDYPATVESAVRSGLRAADTLNDEFITPILVAQ